MVDPEFDGVGWLGFWPRDPMRRVRGQAWVLCVSRISSMALASRVCSPCRLAVMITGQVPAGDPEEGRHRSRAAADRACLVAVPALPGRGDPGRDRARQQTHPHPRSHFASHRGLDRPAGPQLDFGPRRACHRVKFMIRDPARTSLAHSARAGAPAWVPGNLQRFEDAADSGCADPVAELEKLALDPLVSPAVVLDGEPRDQRCDAGAGSARPAPPGRPSRGGGGDWRGAARLPRAAARATRHSWRQMAAEQDQPAAQPREDDV